MPLTVGVLIIGSLLWDEKEERRAWRKDRLDIESSQTVTAPIRYGRKSRSRGDTYTMVLSRSCYQAECGTGHAKVVPCSHAVSSPEELICEAERLWRAEQPDADSGRVCANWGCVGLLGNPDRTIPAICLKEWASRVAREPDYDLLTQALDGGRLIGKEGLLQIDWPVLVEDGAGVGIDFLLATATKPTLVGVPPSFPSVQIIADAWLAAGDHFSYFLNNRKHGISTFQDEAICTYCKRVGRGPHNA